MMRRRIFLWMGLSVLFASLCLSREGLAQETYQVRPGDSLFRISEKMGVSLETLKRANQLQSTKLKPDQILVIPAPEAKKVQKSVKSPSPSREVYTVRKGDTLTGIAKKTGTSVAMLRDLNHLQGSSLSIGKKLALKMKQDPDILSAPAPVEYTKKELLQEQEEEDDGFTGDEIMARIERRAQESKSLLGRWSTPDERELLVKAAMGFLGAPYRLGGFSMKGLDCSGLVKKIYQTFNIDLPRTAFEQSHVGLRVARSKLIEGDLLFFNTRRALGHVGIYIGNDQFVHASSRKRGVRIDNLNTPYFNKRFVRAVRLKGDDDDM
jgi:peptidoglycan endopeptidase LytE